MVPQQGTGQEPPEPRSRAAPIRVLLVDRQELVRRAMRRALEREPDILVVAEAADRAEALSELQRAQPSVAVVSPAGDEGGIGTVRALREQAPECEIVVAWISEDVGDVLVAVEAGARAFLTAHAPPELYGKAVRAAHHGELMIEDHLIAPLLQTLARREQQREEADRFLAPLTPRERTVLALLVAGAGSDRIAELLTISRETARTHTQRILDKLGVHSRLEAVAAASRNPLVVARLSGELSDQGIEV